MPPVNLFMLGKLFNKCPYRITMRNNFYNDMRQNSIGKESQADILKSAYGKVCENVHNCYLPP